MQEIPAIDGTGAIGAPGATTGGVEQTATSAFGLGFEDLLRIVLNQLTYQDPLKPLENFEFVSQLAQFSQIQQTQTSNERLLAILQVDATSQATHLLGATVDIPAGPAVISGTVRSVSFENGEPRLTIETADDRTISNIGLSTVTRVSQGE